eukprot:365232-Chlamydomonas_euryale.AAC.7
MFEHTNRKNGEPAPLVSRELAELVAAHAERIDAEMRYERDFDYDYFGLGVDGCVRRCMWTECVDRGMDGCVRMGVAADGWARQNNAKHSIY